MLCPLSKNHKLVLGFIVEAVRQFRQPVGKSQLIKAQLGLPKGKLNVVLRYLVKSRYVRLNERNHGQPTSYSLLKETEY